MLLNSEERHREPHSNVSGSQFKVLLYYCFLVFALALELSGDWMVIYPYQSKSGGDQVHPAMLASCPVS